METKQIKDFRVQQAQGIMSALTHLHAQLIVIGPERIGLDIREWIANELVAMYHLINPKKESAE